MSVLLRDFDYDFDENLIAQFPAQQRDGARLMAVGRKDGAIRDRCIADLPALLPPGALLVVNDSKVIPARLLARRESGGKVEVLLVEPLGQGRWQCMLRSSKRPRVGEKFWLENSAGDENRLYVTLVEAPQDGFGVVLIEDEAPVMDAGHIPLPPYIQRQTTADDSVRYQTIFAHNDGSIAAPTAGLHFTAELRQRMAEQEIDIATITLHVGPGTFVPVRCEDPRDHKMGSERYTVSEETSNAIADARKSNRPIIAVGTTTVRVLETTGGVAGSGRTELFIFPGHQFRCVDGLITNFHLPKTTLLMLVCAFGGTENVLAAYRHAVAERYRFYSYGDAMLIC